jgi:parallel beta-helix repeat protein
VGGDAKYVRDGKFGYAADFDGDNDYIWAGDDSSISGLDAVTLSLWVNVEDWTGTSNTFKTLAGKGPWGAANNEREYRIRFEADQNLTWFVSEDGSGEVQLGSANEIFIPVSLISEGEWHNVVGTWDSSTGEMHFYLDGVLMASDIFQKASLCDCDANFSVGSSGDNGAYPGNPVTSNFDDFNGTIDEVAVWNRALSEDEIEDLYRLNYGTYDWQVNVTDDTGRNGSSETRVFNIVPAPLPPLDITNCPFELDQEGRIYQVLNDINYAGGTCFNVTADDILLDGNGYTVNGSQDSGNYGIHSISNSELIVRNLTLSNFWHNILLQDFTDAVVYDVVANHSGSENIFLIEGSDFNLSNNNFYDSAGSIVRFENIVSCFVSGNSIGDISNGPGLYLEDSSNCIVEGNEFENTSTAIYLAGTDGGVVYDNSISGGGIGIRLEGSSGNSFLGGEIGNVERSAIELSVGSLDNIFNSVNVTDTDIAGYDLIINDSSVHGTQFIDMTLGRYLLRDNFVTFSKTGIGEIEFLDTINGTGNNLSSDVMIKNNFAAVDSDSNVQLNSSARVTLENLGTIPNPQIFRNDEICSSEICKNLTALDEDTVVFNVTGWTNYSIRNEFELTECGELKEYGKTYFLANDISNIVGSCFIIKNDSIVLDGNGFTLSGLNSFVNGVVGDGVKNVTVKNIRIQGAGASGLTGAIIFSSCQVYLKDNIIIPNTDRYGIVLSDCYNSTLENLEVNTSGAQGGGHALSIGGGSGNKILRGRYTRTTAYAGGVSVASEDLLIENSIMDSEFLGSRHDLTIGTGTPGVKGVHIKDSTIGHFKFGGTSDSDPSSPIIIENSSAGKIYFYNGVHMTAQTNYPPLKNTVIIRDNYAFVNYNDVGFNRPANVTLYNMQDNIYPDPVILVDDVECIAANNCRNYTSLGGVPNVTIGLDSWRVASSLDEANYVSIGTRKLTACAELNVTNGYYELGANFYALDDCFKVKAENVTLNGNGYTVTRHPFASSNVLGVHNSAGFIPPNEVFHDSDGFELENITFSGFGNSIYLGGIDDGSFVDVESITSGDSGAGIKVFNGSDGNYFLRVSSEITGSSASGIGFEIEGGSNLFFDISVEGADDGIFIRGDDRSNVIRNAVFDSIDDKWVIFNDYGPTIINTYIEDYEFRSNMEGFAFANSTYGAVIYRDFLGATTGSNLSNVIQFKYNLASVDTDLDDTFNKTATVVLYGYPAQGINDPVLFRNGAFCPEDICNLNSPILASTVNFNVTHWTNYSIGSLTDLYECRELDLPNKTYHLMADIGPVSGTCFNITAENVALDGGGYDLVGLDQPDNWAVFSENQENITVKNLVIDNFERGIFFRGVSNSLVENNTIEGGSEYGIHFLTLSDNNTVRYNNLSSNLYGLRLYQVDGFSVSDNVFANNSIGISCFNTIGSGLLQGNVLDKNTEGIHLFSCDDHDIVNNLFDSNNDSLILEISNRNFVFGGRIENSLNSSILIKGVYSQNNTLRDIDLLNDQSTTDLFIDNGVNGTHLIDIFAGRYSFSDNLIIFGNSQEGEIQFLEAVDGSGSNLSDDLRLENNLARVLSDSNSGLNKSALITLENNPYAGQDELVIRRDGIICDETTNPSCYNSTALNESTVVFNVSSWTDYMIAPENELPIVELVLPEDNNVTTNRTPTFIWNGTDKDGDQLEYELNISCYSTPGDNSCPSDDRLVSIPGGPYNEGEEQNYTLTEGLRYLSDEGYYYLWSVRANDSQNYGPWATPRRLNVSSLIDIHVINENVSFGIIEPNGINDTLDNSPFPFVVENTGNSFVNISLNFTELWDSVLFGGLFYRFKIDRSTITDLDGQNLNEPNSFNYGASRTSWQNIGPYPDPSLENVIVDLNYSDASDLAEVDLYIRAPAGEGGGKKESTVTFIAKLGSNI